MQFSRWMATEQAAIAMAAAAGSFVALMVAKRTRWAEILTLFVIGQITAFYWTIFVAQRLGFGMEAYGWVGFLLGFLGMAFWGTVAKVAESFLADPKASINWALDIWKGRNS